MPAWVVPTARAVSWTPLAGVSGANGTVIVVSPHCTASGRRHCASRSSTNCQGPLSDIQPSRSSCGRGYA